jgi:hypothetical protein
VAERRTDRNMRNIPLVILLSNWYSGATLLTLLLNRHPELVTNGEIFPGRTRGRVKHTLCSCGSPVDECPFYRAAAGHMWKDGRWDPTLFRWGPALSGHPRLQRLFATTRFFGPAKLAIRESIPGVGPRTRRFLDAQEVFLGNALEILSGSVYLDGSKSLGRAELSLSVNRHARCPVILLVREPASWCASWMRRRPRATLDNAIRSWKEYIERALRLSRAFPGADLHIVRYEDICDDPRARLSELFRFIGLDDDPGILLNMERCQHHVLGNEMRLTFDGRVRPATDRSGELASSDQATILRACRNLTDVVLQA